MNAIDIIEARRIKEGISIEDLCRKTGRVSQPSYSKYRSRENKPDYEAVVLLMKAVGIKLIAVDELIKSNANIDKWGIIELWVSSNKAEMFRIFEKATGFNVSQQYHQTLRYVLFYVWFYKTQKVAPPDRLMGDVIQGTVSSGTINEELNAWGIVLKDKPSETAFEFYQGVEESIQYFLEHTSIAKEITID